MSDLYKPSNSVLCTFCWLWLRNKNSSRIEKSGLQATTFCHTDSLVHTYPHVFFSGGTAFEVQEGGLAQTVVKAAETGSGGLFQDGPSLQPAQASILSFSSGMGASNGY